MKERIFAGISVLMYAVVFLFLSTPLYSGSEKVLAKIGEKVLTENDLQEVMKTYEVTRKGKSFTVEEKKRLLDNMIKGTILVMEAEKHRLDESPDVKAKLQRYRNELLVKEYIKTQIAPTVIVTDEEIQGVIKKSPNLFPKELLTLKEILVKTEKEAEEIYEELKKGADFSMMAVNRSIAHTGVSGGHMRKPVGRGDLPKPLEEVAFSLKKGEFSRPIKTDKGYYLLYLVDRKETPPSELEKFKEKIINTIRDRKIQEEVEKKIEELKKNIKIEVFYDRVE